MKRRVPLNPHRIATYEAQAQRKMTAFFKRQGRVISARIRAGAGKSYQKALRNDQWWDEQRWASELDEDLKALYADVIDGTGSEAIAQIGRGTFRMDDPKVRAYITDKAGKVSKYVNDTTADDVRQKIADGEAAGLSIDEIASSVAGYFDGTDAQALSRAECVARTEVIGASNYGLLAAADQSGVATGKTWLTAGDCADECADLDGATVGLDETFDTGDDQPPLHPNCRCTLLIETADGTTEETDDSEG